MPKFQSKKLEKGKTKKNMGNKEIPIDHNKTATIKLILEKLFRKLRKKTEPNPKQTIITMAKIDFLINNVLSL